MAGACRSRGSLKIQRPGPGSPGGPRVRRRCEVCRSEFWPRAVDVDAGKGKHCSNACSSKVFRKAIELTCAGCGTRFRSKHPNVKYHSDQCRIANAPRQQKKRWRCERCGLEFVRRSRDSSKRFCTPEHAVAYSRAKIEIAGELLDVAEVARHLGISLELARNRIRQARLAGGNQLKALVSPGPRGGARKGGGRKAAPLTFRGETHSRAEWSMRIGISAGTLRNRLRDGWPLERALAKKEES